MQTAGRAAGRAKHHAPVPMEAYLFLPGVGTVVLSVKSNGHTTIAPVPAHLNELNFAVNSQTFALRGVRYDLDRSKVVDPALRTQRRGIV